jgi:hypothetical protein
VKRAETNFRNEIEIAEVDMDEANFNRFLKRMGKQDHVVKELAQEVLRFESFLVPAGKPLEQASTEESCRT